MGSHYSNNSNNMSNQTAFERLRNLHKQLESRDEGPEALPSSPTGSKRGRDAVQLRKAPQAPKRFKSSYICFFQVNQPKIKKEMGPEATVTEVSRRSAEIWRNLSAEEKAHWEDIAAKDKERYMTEKASYHGPWQVPVKRARKDPSAPKRPMSAFLYFAVGKRSIIRKENPEMVNTDVSRLLGEMWRNASESVREPFVEKEKKEREKYKIAMAKWREENEAKKEKERKQKEEQATNWSGYTGTYETSSPQMPYTQAMYPLHPPAQHGYPHPYGMSYHQMKQPVILGPNGMPHFPVPSTMMPTPPSRYPAPSTSVPALHPQTTYIMDNHQNSTSPSASNLDLISSPTA